MSSVPRQNNFHLLRLFAACTVVFSHLTQHGIILSPTLIKAADILWQFLPGVPIFFIISGFLITHSWLGNPNWKPYLKARALRILPALFICTWVTVGLLWLCGYTTSTGKMLNWVFGQVSTLAMYHTPAAFTPFSGYMPNASLWTIPVEVQFYLILPLLLLAITRFRRPLLVLLPFITLSLLMVLFNDFGLKNKVLHLTHTIFHHFFWFGLGVYARLDWPRLTPHLTNRFTFWFTLHSILFFTLFFLLPHAKVLAILPTLTLAPAILAAAFSHTWLTGKTVGNTDASYGLYLYHRPFIHTLTHFHLTGLLGTILALTFSTAAALLSWHIIEKPMLSLKNKNPLKQA